MELSLQGMLLPGLKEERRLLKDMIRTVQEIQSDIGLDGYRDPTIRAYMERQVALLGEMTTVTILGKGSWKIPRHFIGLHGFKAAEIAKESTIESLTESRKRFAVF